MALAVLSTLTLLGGMLDFPDILGNYGMWAGSGAYAWRCSNMVAVLVVLVLGAWQSLDLASAATPTCAPTRPGSLEPFYEPNAPERDSTRQGLSISGIVRSAKDCHALGGARIEGWSANARGDYNATHRAT